MDLNATILPDSSVELKGIVGKLHDEITDLRNRHDKETGILLEQISLLRAQLYGRKSEKIIPEDGPRPLPLFDMPEPVDNDEDDDDKGTIPVPAHNRKKRGRKPLPVDLPRIEVVHDIDDADKVCDCGCDKTLIGEERSEKLNIIPAKAQVIVHIRPKYACKNCEGTQDDGATVTIAPVHAQIIPKSIASPGLLAHIITAKFTDHLPFYRQEKQFTRIGVEISRTSMCNWAMQAAAACQPLLNLLQDEVLEGDFVNIDETTLQVLREPGRSPTSKSYMWLFRRGDPEKPILIYQYRPSRAADVAKTFLGDFRGYVQTDGYVGYDFLDSVEGIVHIGCWAHARRKFTDVLKSLGKNPKSSSADKALKYIKKLYKLEKKARKGKWSYNEIYHMRQNEAKPILDEFKKWLSKQILLTPPKGLFGKAIAYALNQWKRLAGYIKNGCLTIDNNMAENSIRPFVVGRKNWLFAGSPKGAEASALLYSLIETAKANKLEPYAYLRCIFGQLPVASSLEDYEALLPWNIQEHMEHSRLVECA